MSHRRLLALCILVLLLSLTVTPPTFSQNNGNGNGNGNGRSFREYELVVTLKPGYRVNDVNNRNNTHFLKQIPGTNIYLVSTSTHEKAKDKISKLAKDNAVANISLNYIIKSAEVQQSSDAFLDQSSDAFLDHQSPINFYGQPATTNLHLAEAHNLATGNGVRVAVIDTGIDLNHSLFAGRLAYPMYDFVDNDGLPQDELGGNGTGHGTAVAGLIALTAPQATIMPLRAFTADGSGSSFDIASAIHFAADNGARVLNLSFGFTEEDPVVQEALSYALPSSYMVAAAGNDNLNMVHYPAVDTSKTLSVTSIGNNDVKASFANFHTGIQVAAPGVSVYTAYPGNHWAWWSGTSFSTPLVAGEAALLLSVRNNLSRTNLNTIITSAGVNINPLNPNYVGQLGYVRIDYLAAVNLALTY